MALQCLMSFPGQTKRKTTIGFKSTQTRLLDGDVVARDRNNALPFRELDLEHHHILSAERHFRRSKIKLPHAHEALIIEALRLLSVSVETLTPGLQRVGIVQAQDFDVGNEQTRAFDRGQYLGQSRNIPTRKYVFRDPRIGDAGPLGATDCMQHHDSVVGQYFGAAAEECAVEIDTDMLEHSDRYDAIEPVGDVAIVLEAEVDHAKMLFGRAAASECQLFIR